ncbi:MAG: hypothetical protein A3J85_07350 [Desulfobacula sp. RIFOXYA12_FULL_46_16]|nr:MAG: hypothetical protein A3J85_07350 [Desulfobacula sp. RIFOXYA12_FULL_46_16]
MYRKEIILIGGGGHCRSCIDVIESVQEFKIAGIVEQPGKTKSILGYPVLGSDKDLENLKNIYEYALITIGQMGSSMLRQKIFNHLKKLGFALPVMVSSLAHVSRYASLGEGTIVMHQAMVNVGASIGRNCILNTKCLVEHDAKIGDHTHISTGAVLNGETMIGSGSFVGSNATIVQGARFPDNLFFKAGSLVCSERDGQAMKENHGF